MRNTLCLVLTIVSLTACVSMNDPKYYANSTALYQQTTGAPELASRADKAITIAILYPIFSDNEVGREFKAATSWTFCSKITLWCDYDEREFPKTFVASQFYAALLFQELKKANRDAHIVLVPAEIAKESGRFALKPLYKYSSPLTEVSLVAPATRGKGVYPALMGGAMAGAEYSYNSNLAEKMTIVTLAAADRRVKPATGGLVLASTATRLLSGERPKLDLAHALGGQGREEAKCEPGDRSLSEIAPYCEKFRRQVANLPDASSDQLPISEANYLLVDKPSQLMDKDVVAAVRSGKDLAPEHLAGEVRHYAAALSGAMSGMTATAVAAWESASLEEYAREFDPELVSAMSAGRATSPAYQKRLEAIGASRNAEARMLSEVSAKVAQSMANDETARTYLRLMAAEMKSDLAGQQTRYLNTQMAAVVVAGVGSLASTAGANSGNMTMMQMGGLLESTGPLLDTMARNVAMTAEEKNNETIARYAAELRETSDITYEMNQKLFVLKVNSPDDLRRTLVANYRKAFNLRKTATGV